MLTEVKKQFFKETLKELEEIKTTLNNNNFAPEDNLTLAERIFSVSHQISGTGPMLGFYDTSILSRKLERTFHDIRSGERIMTHQITLQTKRTIEAIIQCFNKENQ